jgi:hypothetical protein
VVAGGAAGSFVGGACSVGVSTTGAISPPSLVGAVSSVTSTALPGVKVGAKIGVEVGTKVGVLVLLTAGADLSIAATAS